MDEARVRTCSRSPLMSPLSSCCPGGCRSTQRRPDSPLYARRWSLMIDAYRRPTARHRPSGPHAHAALAGSSPIDVPRLHLPLKGWSLRKLRGGSTAWTALSLTGSRNDPNLTPVWFAMKSIHTRSLAVPRPRPAKKAANRSSTTRWRRTVPSALPAARNTAKTRPTETLASASPTRITSAFGSGMNRQAILRRCEQCPAALRASPRRL